MLVKSRSGQGQAESSHDEHDLDLRRRRKHEHDRTSKPPVVWVKFEVRTRQEVMTRTAGASIRVISITLVQGTKINRAPQCGYPNALYSLQHFIHNRCLPPWPSWHAQASSACMDSMSLAPTECWWEVNQVIQYDNCDNGHTYRSHSQTVAGQQYPQLAPFEPGRLR